MSMLWVILLMIYVQFSTACTVPLIMSVVGRKAEGPTPDALATAIAVLVRAIALGWLLAPILAVYLLLDRILLGNK